MQLRRDELQGGSCRSFGDANPARTDMHLEGFEFIDLTRERCEFRAQRVVFAAPGHHAALRRTQRPAQEAGGGVVGPGDRHQAPGRFPTRADIPDTVRNRRSDAVEEHLVGLAVAVDEAYRLHSDAGPVHLYQEKDQSCAASALLIASRKQEHVGRVPGKACPQLAAGEDEIIAVAFGAQRQRRQVRTGLRF